MNGGAAQTSGAPLVDARDLTVSFGVRRGAAAARPAIDGVSIAIRRGEVVGIVGESGSGKTTVGRSLLGLIRPTSGSVRFDGRDLATLSEPAMRPLRARMQMIFQDPMSSLNPRHTIRRILVEPLMLHRLAEDRHAAEGQVVAVLERVGLTAAVLGRYPHEISGGQRQRIGIARAVVLKPEFLLADEIVSGLDVSTQAMTLTLIGGLVRSMGLAMAFISHDLSVIRAVCDRVVVLREGRIVEAGACESLFTAPKDAYTRALIDAIPLPVPDPAWLASA